MDKNEEGKTEYVTPKNDENDIPETVAYHADDTNTIGNEENEENEDIYNVNEEIEKDYEEGKIYRTDIDFEDLIEDERLLRAVYGMHFQYPSMIQASAIPEIINGRNFIGQAQHGSGKTAAFALGMLSKINENKLCPQAIIICPTRELTIQVSYVVKQLAKYTNIKIFSGVPSQKPKKKNSGILPYQVIISSPGTILNMLRDCRIDVKEIKIFCFDEADVLVDSIQVLNMNQRDNGQFDSNNHKQHQNGVDNCLGFDKNLSYLKNSLSDQAVNAFRQIPDCQVLLFSATFKKDVRELAKTVAPNAVKILLKERYIPINTIKQFLVYIENIDSKYSVLKELYSTCETIGQCIIFCQTIANAKSLCNLLREDGFAVSILFGKGMDPINRDMAMQDFRDHKTTVLVTTNVLSRGIDVASVSTVINYDVPKTFGRYSSVDFETYTHRIGRAGRFGRDGVAINFAESEAEYCDFCAIGQKYDMKMHEIYLNNVDQAINLSREISKHICT